MTWVKPIPHDNWGNESVRYERDGTEIRPGFHRFLFPDGTEQELEVVSVPVTNQISDHGKPYAVPTQRLMAKISLHGMEQLVELRSLKEVLIWQGEELTAQAKMNTALDALCRLAPALATAAHLMRLSGNDEEADRFAADERLARQTILMLQR